MNEKRPIAAIDILNVPIGSLAKFETKRLYEYLVEATKKCEEARRLKQWLHAAIALKFDPYIGAKRHRLEKYIDIIYLEDSNFKISNEVPKKIEWRQDVLARLLASFVAKGGNIPDYVEVSYHIPEAKYEALPQELKYKFNAARIIKLGNPVYKIIKVKKGLREDNYYA